MDNNLNEETIKDNNFAKFSTLSQQTSNNTENMIKTNTNKDNKNI